MRELRLRLALFLLRKEVQDMAVVYATLIIKGRKTILTRCPLCCVSRWRKSWQTWRLRSKAPAQQEGHTRVVCPSHF